MPAQRLCPYCGQLLGTGQKALSKDHIFVEKLGGTAWIRAHRRCNNRLGTEVEGPLQGKGTLISFLLHLQGRGGKPIQGTLGETSHVVELDLQRRQSRSVKPMYAIEDGYLFIGSPGQLDAVTRSLGITEADRQAAIDQLPRFDLLKVGLRSPVTLDPRLLYRLAAKVALGAGAKAFGDSFTESAPARSLREAMSGDAVDLFAVSVGLLDQIQRWWERHGTPMPTLTAPPGIRRVIFVPLPSRTAVFVFLGIDKLVMGGLVVGGGLPIGEGLPVIIDDAPGGVLVGLLSDRAGAPLRMPRFDISESPRPSQDG
jgi:hypothetical protein